MQQCTYPSFFRQPAPVIAAIFGLLCAQAAVPFNRIVNYRSTACVNAFAADGDKLWVATTGGLYCHSRSAGTGTLYSDPVLFPDPEITALCIDARRTLWAGTAKGYIYKRTSSGKQTVANAYFMAGWSITALDTAGGYLIVGTEEGCSLFDTDKLIALKNSSGFAEGFPSRVNTMAVFRDTLLLGTGKGIVKLCDTTGKTLVETLASANFYDPTIWKFDSSNTSEVGSIIVMQNGYKAMAGPSARFQNRIVYGDGETIFADSQNVYALPSGVTALFSMNSRECFAGTAKSCFFVWDGTTAPRAIKIDGPVFSTVQNILVGRDGSAWVSSPVSGNYPSLPWDGYSAFRNGYWHLYGPVDFPAIGWMGQGTITGGAEDRMGRIWLGSQGGSVKRYDPASDSWQKYCIYASTQGAGFESNKTGACGGANWAMTDAITVDSSGYLWITCYNNLAGTLIGYDTRFEPDPAAMSHENAHYRRFWPKGDPLYSDDYNPISLITTDAANNIIVGYPNGQIVVFRHNGNPLRDSIAITTVYSENRSLVLDAVSTTDSLTRIVSSGDFYTFDARTNQFWKDLCIVSPSSGVAKISVLDTLREISALEAEDEKVLWLGTMNSGIIRYDLAAKSKTVIDETQGLLSNHITDLSLDRNGGFLWIASDRGVSRYAIGYKIGVKNNGAPFVCPNPFSKRRHNELVFGDLAPASRVNVYTVSGTLVATLSPEETSAHGSVCVWKPSRAIVPGVYLYTIRSTTNISKGRCIITP